MSMKRHRIRDQERSRYPVPHDRPVPSRNAADEAPKEHELIGVLGRRAGDVERLYQTSTSLRRIRFAGHWLCSSQRA